MENNKPKCKLIGKDGNIFNLVRIASETLKENGKYAEADKMCSQVFASKNYKEALIIIGDYVEII